MTRKILAVAIVAAGIAISGAILAGTNAEVHAQTATSTGALANVQYPIASLGNCSSQEACKQYCDDSAHASACLAFAKTHGLMTEKEVNIAEELAQGSLQGPGGCTSLGSCQTYCSNIDHINECLAFAEKTGITPPGGFEQAKKIQTAIANGVKPPACTDKEECDQYCSQPAHMKECITFAQAAGILQGQELQNAEKTLTAIDKGVTPPPCQGGDSCNAYCNASADHMQQCVAFAQAAGLMTPQEVQQSQGAIKALQAGVAPPACQGQQQCDEYCAEPAHVAECTNFAVAAGFMTQSQADQAQKTGGKGPGGCVGQDACQAFCNDPHNQQTCFQFAKDNNLISPEDLQKMQQGEQQMQQALAQASPDTLSCLEKALGSDTLDKLKNGQMMADQSVGQEMQQCFQLMHPPQGQGGPNQQSGPQGQFTQNASGTPPHGGQFPPNGQTPPQGRSFPLNASGTSPESGQFPNGGPFPGQGRPMTNGQEGNFPQGQMPPRGQGQFSPNGQLPPNGQFSPMTGEGEGNQQGDQNGPQGMMQQFQGQFAPNGQMPQQGEQPNQGQMPPNGQPPVGQFSPNGMPSNGQFLPANQMPPSGQQPPQGTMVPPPNGETPPPASTATPPPPSSGNIMGAFDAFVGSLLGVGK